MFLTSLATLIALLTATAFTCCSILVQEFLQDVALPGKLSIPLPDNNTDLIKQPLWDYLEKACYTRQWSPGKIFIGFNVSSNTQTGEPVFGDFHRVSRERMAVISLNKTRQLIPYDAEFHRHRAVYFSGHEKNRLLTHWYVESRHHC
jgi:hypothetical protein